MDPSFYESDEQKYLVLMKNETLRYEIFGDVLNSHLGLVTDIHVKEDDTMYTKGFFLGRHDVSDDFILTAPLNLNISIIFRTNSKFWNF